MGVVTSAVLIGTSLAMKGLEMSKAYSTAKGNSAIAEAQGYAQKKAIDRRVDVVLDEQMDAIGRARGMMGKSGGGVGQDQPLMLEAKMRSKMSMDIAELKYTGETAYAKGVQLANQFDDQATAAIISGVTDMAMTASKGYSTIRDANVGTVGQSLNAPRMDTLAGGGVSYGPYSDY
jgi:hypothetical protein